MSEVWEDNTQNITSQFRSIIDDNHDDNQVDSSRIWQIVIGKIYTKF